MMLHQLSVIGIALLAGLTISKVIKRIHMPQVIGHIVIGILLGLSGFKLFGNHNLGGFEVVSNLALGIIGFSIGGELRWARLKRVGLSILSITLFEATFSTVFVFLAVWLVTNSLPLALILGALASATAPGGTTNVIQQYRTRGPLTNTLFGVIGADDALAILIYTFAYNISKTMLIAGEKISAQFILSQVSCDILGGLVLGLTGGLCFLWAMKQLKDDDSRLLLTLAAIFTVSGIAMEHHFSLILSNMALGITISNARPHQSKPFFTSIQKVTPPIYILFFILVGARLQVSLLPTMGLIGLIYILFRTVGKMSGSWIGALVAKSPKQVRNYLGVCLLSQAGVALGLAISAQNELSQLSPNTSGAGILFSGPEMATIILNVITATTLVFQIIGPIMTKYGLEKAGEIKKWD